jgi:hypothetical protein
MGRAPPAAPTLENTRPTSMPQAINNGIEAVIFAISDVMRQRSIFLF